METKTNELSVKLDETAANICYSGACVTCRYYDPNYHRGYCDKHKVDTTPSSTCPDYWAR